MMSALSTPITNQGFVIPLYSKNGYNLLVDVVLHLGGGVNSCYSWFLDVLNEYVSLLPLSKGVNEVMDTLFQLLHLLKKGEDAVVLALASYKCGEGVHPVGYKLVVGCVSTHRLNILPPQWGRSGGGYPFGFIPQLIKKVGCVSTHRLNNHPLPQGARENTPTSPRGADLRTDDATKLLVRIASRLSILWQSHKCETLGAWSKSKTGCPKGG